MTYFNDHFYKNSKSNKDPSKVKPAGETKTCIGTCAQSKRQGRPSTQMAGTYPLIGYVDFDLHSCVYASLCFMDLVLYRYMSNNFHLLVSPLTEKSHTTGCLTSFHGTSQGPPRPGHNCGCGELHQQSKGVLPLPRSVTCTYLPKGGKTLAGRSLPRWLIYGIYYDLHDITEHKKQTSYFGTVGLTVVGHGRNVKER
jgi:hypothetical protein